MKVQRPSHYAMFPELFFLFRWNKLYWTNLFNLTKNFIVSSDDYQLTNLFKITKNFIVSSDGYQLKNFINVSKPANFCTRGVFGYGDTVFVTLYTTFSIHGEQCSTQWVSTEDLSGLLTESVPEVSGIRKLLRKWVVWSKNSVLWKKISKMSPNRLIFCTRGFSAMGNTMAILFFNKIFVKIKN